VSTGAIGGLAGCGGGDQGGESDGQTSPLPEEVKENIPTTAGSQSDTLIPGKIVHHKVSGVEVVDHWAEQDQNDWVKLKIQNNRDEPFKKPASIYEKDIPIIRGRTLTEQGNKLASDVWYGGAFGPGKINTGTSATIGLDCGPATPNAARYEICLYTKSTSLSLSSWKKGCTEWTPTASPTPTPGPGPGSNDLVHNGIDNLEVMGQEVVNASEENWLSLEIDLKNTGDQSLKNYYVAVQFFDKWGRYYPPREPRIVEGGPGPIGSTVDRTIEPGETKTITVGVEKTRFDTYEICIGTDQRTVIETCEWSRN
jgi:hypothetical protein